MPNSNTENVQKTAVVDGSVSEIAGGRGYALHHDGCPESFPPMFRGKMPKVGKIVTCECKVSVKITEANGIWD